MGKRPGELTPRELAERVGVHYKTAIEWVADAEAPDPNRPPRIPPEAIRRDVVGRIHVKEMCISTIIASML